MSASVCKSCGAPIRWITTPQGKSMPLDEKARTMWLIDGDALNSLNPSARPVQVRESHFSTCPQAAEHRSRSTPPANDETEWSGPLPLPVDGDERGE